MQSNNDTKEFNKGAMFNIGFKKAMEDDPTWDCIILHDVDMVPMAMSNLYKCGTSVSYKEILFNESIYETFELAIQGAPKLLGLFNKITLAPRFQKIQEF